MPTIQLFTFTFYTLSKLNQEINYVFNTAYTEFEQNPGKKIA